MRNQKGIPKVDAFPSYFPYHDDGCDISASCLGCPLTMCKYDNPNQFKHERRLQRDKLVLETCLHENVTMLELSRRFKVSERTVSRILTEAKP